MNFPLVSYEHVNRNVNSNWCTGGSGLYTIIGILFINNPKSLRNLSGAIRKYTALVTISFQLEKKKLAMLFESKKK